MIDSLKAKVYKEYSGVLDLHWETGYEGSVFAHLYVNKFDSVNPNFDSKDSNKGPEVFRSYEGMVSLDLKDVLEITDCALFPEFNGLKFLMGNRDLGMTDGFYLGRAYPINVDKKFDLDKWKKMFACGTTKAKVQKLIKKVCLYGGTFDPFHEGHLAIINDLHYSFNEVLVLVNNNWTKLNEPMFTLDERINSVKAVSEYFLNVSVLDWAKSEDTSSTYSVAKKVKSLYGVEPYVVIGTDNLNQIQKWKNSEKLVKEFPFAIILRKGYELDKKLVESLGIKCIYFDRAPQISSTEIKASHSDAKIPEAVKKCLDLRKLK
jgi:nicotinate-nucleotide adenylyltransferase